MHATLGLAAILLLLAGCADMPETSYAPSKPVVDAKSMQPFLTRDPDEIRRRWGDYEHFLGETFITDSKNPVEMFQGRWVVKGALARLDWNHCWESTRKCSSLWFWVQYDAAQRRLNFLLSDGINVWASAVVQPDGSVKVTPINSLPYVVRYDYETDEGLIVYSEKRTTRYVPTDGQQYAEAVKTWNQIHAETVAEEARAAREQAAEQARFDREREASQRAELARRRGIEPEDDGAARWGRALSAFGQAYSDTMAQHRRQQAETAARNARLAASLQSSRPSTSSSSSSARSTSSPTPRTAVPNVTRPQAIALAPSPLTPLPKAATSRSAPASPSSRTPQPLKTNPLQIPRLSEDVLVAPQQPQNRGSSASTTSSAPARVAPPTPMVTVPVQQKPQPLPQQREDRSGRTEVATAPPTLRDPKREWEERRERDSRGEDDRRDPGKASTRDDPYTCITKPIEADPVIGTRASCKAFRVYNRCDASVDIRTCVYLTGTKKWSCELKTVSPNGYKQHESCLPHRERFVAVKYADDYKTRMAMPR